MLGELIPVGPRQPGVPSVSYKLHKHILLVGRRPDCDIVIPHRTVSAHHCRLLIRQGYWFVNDLDSSNGTRVNGFAVDEHRLDPGDTLWIALLRFQIKYCPLDLGSVGPPPADDVLETPEDILGQSLIERTASGSGIGSGIHSRQRSLRPEDTQRLPPQDAPARPRKAKPSAKPSSGILGGLLRRKKGGR